MAEALQSLSAAVTLFRRADIRLASGSLDAWDPTLPDGRELPSREGARNRPRPRRTHRPAHTTPAHPDH
ncbi:hypothetical protein ACLBYD_27435 [Rhodococcus sp. C26F]